MIDFKRMLATKPSTSGRRLFPLSKATRATLTTPSTQAAAPGTSASPASSTGGSSSDTLRTDDVPTLDPATAAMFERYLNNARLGLKRIPLWVADPTLVEFRLLPCDEQAETSPSVVSNMVARAAQTPFGALSTLVAGTGVGTLSLPAISSSVDPFRYERIIVPALMIEVSVVESTGSLGSISANISGHFADVPSAAHDASGENLIGVDASPSFQSGTFIFAPRSKDAKASMLLIPYQVVNGRTYPRPLVMSRAAGVSGQGAGLVVNPPQTGCPNFGQQISISISAAPAGAIIEMQAITTSHGVFRLLEQALLTA